MGSGKAKKPSKLSHRNNKGNPLGPKTKKRKKEKKQRLSNGGSNENPIDEKASNQSNQNSDGLRDGEVQPASVSAQLRFFLDKFQSANGVSFLTSSWSPSMISVFWISLKAWIKMSASGGNM
ncbi:uncharacterized protein [Malus domestica]|uniref:uncharacterized protein n=1 Tax=Malus domestica TaxID=3750 RepID=UPI000498B124|nr:uncharacterized protein LOC103444307 [Malus domestica]